MSDNSTIHHVQGAQDGDPLSFERLEERLRPWLMQRLSGESMPPGYTPEDVVNAALGEVFADIARFQMVEGSNFRKWALTVTLNQLEDLRRRGWARKRNPPGGVLSLDADSGGDASAPPQVADPKVTRASIWARCREIEAALRAAMAEFDPATRRVLELRILNDMTFDDIARDPHIKWRKVETIRVVFFRAKDKLHTRLRKFDT